MTLKCTKEKCDKEAIYVIDGNSVCKDHGKKNPYKQDETMGDRLVGRTI